MNTSVSIICIGDELLKGKINNTHLSFIGNQLLKKGIIPELQMSVKDEINDIQESISYCSEKSNIIIITGGLGPTTDDITVESVANLYNRQLIQDKNAVETLKQFLKDRGLCKISDANLKQTYIPEVATIIENPNGTAPGVKLSLETTTLFLLPGPPHEMQPMFINHVLPFILENNAKHVFSESIYAIGVPESGFQETVSKLLGKTYNQFNVSFRANPGICELMIIGDNKEKVHAAVVTVKNYYQHQVLSDEFSTPEEELAQLLTKKKLSLATAESCTGGMIASKITDVPGASSFYKGSCITYSNEFKEKLLGVSSMTLNNFGAVSKECAKEMVEGLCHKYNSDTGIAVTGIAGPGGGTYGKPVGLVYIAVKLLNKTVVHEHYMRGSREIIRTRTALTALDTLRKMLLDQ